jgi:hypothetical protein
LNLDNPRISPQSTLNFEDTKDERLAVGARFGFWLFRFLNVYVTGGGAWGEATTKGTYASTPFDLKVKYHGGQVGVGGTVALGYKSFFLVVDSNYSWLFLNVSNETNNSYYISPKIGMMIESENTGNGAFYVGVGI